MAGKAKALGQVYTPHNIVNDMLNIIGYQGSDILKKHIIDNSCGDGAFLRQIVKRYINEYEKMYGNLDGVKNELEKYIHGIDIDTSAHFECIKNLSTDALSFGLQNIEWDIMNADALDIHQYDDKMDYVVGNPPYIRIHNLMDNFQKVRQYEFAKYGMTDMYIVFYEIGFKMLNQTGKLCYITPNSFYTSGAGDVFRHYIISTKHLYSLTDLGHYQPFSATTYTTICAFDFAKTYDSFDFQKYTNNGDIIFEERLNTMDAFNNGKMILAKKKEQQFLIDIQNYIPKYANDVIVKNGFATLSDKVFIKDDFEFENNTIDVIKASTGEWKKAIFPYEGDKIIKFTNLDTEVQNYLLNNKDKLENRSLDKNSSWYAYGRSQAILDTNKNKFAINTTIKDKNSIKLSFVSAGKGVYSGLYIITSLSEDELRKILITDDFINYIKIIGKCKNGGYYTFSSSDLRQFILYQKEHIDE